MGSADVLPSPGRNPEVGEGARLGVVAVGAPERDRDVGDHRRRVAGVVDDEVDDGADLVLDEGQTHGLTDDDGHGDLPAREGHAPQAALEVVVVGGVAHLGVVLDRGEADLVGRWVRRQLLGDVVGSRVHRGRRDRFGCRGAQLPQQGSEVVGSVTRLPGFDEQTHGRQGPFGVVEGDVLRLVGRPVEGFPQLVGVVGLGPGDELTELRAVLGEDAQEEAGVVEGVEASADPVGRIAALVHLRPRAPHERVVLRERPHHPPQDDRPPLDVLARPQLRHGCSPPNPARCVNPPRPQQVRV